MKIPVADPVRENIYLGINEKNLFNEFKKGIYVGGENVNNFENNLQKFLNVKYAISLNSGTDALLLGFIAAGLSKGDEVLVPSFTYFATVEVLLNLGAIPVFVDIHPKTFTLNLEDAKGKISKKTKAIVPVHLFGNNADIEALKIFSKKHNLIVVEDGAQSFGSMTKEKKHLGTFGTFGAYSFFPSKTLGGIGDGGCLVTNSSKIFNTVSKLKNHGQSGVYNHEISGINSRLDSLNAFVLNKKLLMFNKIKKSRNDLTNFYNENLKDFKFIEVPKKENPNILFNYYSILVPSNVRNDLINYLEQNQISTSIYYKRPIHKQPVMKKYKNVNNNLKTTEKISKSIVSLPFFSFMSSNEREKVIRVMKGFK